ncbi:unnamed protein product, partial [Amoebophrya sp. A25]|eukprot:GSA25T00001132001.1
MSASSLSSSHAMQRRTVLPVLRLLQQVDNGKRLGRLLESSSSLFPDSP